MVKKDGSGHLTKSWKNHWAGDIPLRVRFPRNFSISDQKDSCVGEVGKSDRQIWVWDLKWSISRVF